MKWLLYGIGAYLLYNYMQTQGGFAFPSLHPAIPTPGSQIPIWGGISITVPGGTTYRLYNGDYVTVSGIAGNAPGGWLQGTLGSTGEAVWFNPLTSQVQPIGQ